MAKMLIEAKDLSVFRGRREILSDVSLDVGERDFVTIIGPNGAGKSMLLKCLVGFYKPDRGVVLAKRRLRVGYAPQSLSPDYAMPISARRLLALKDKSGNGAVSRLAEETGIADVLDEPMHLLSGGQLQRAMLARALLNEPELLVLDEPAQNLDICGQISFYQLLERVYREHAISILMVSHDLHFVMRCAKQLICLRQRVCCRGAPAEVARMPAFVDMFGNELTEMMTAYRHVHTGGIAGLAAAG